MSFSSAGNTPYAIYAEAGKVSEQYIFKTL